MNTILWILGGVVCNMVVGAGVWASIDDKEQRMLRWYKDCPPQIAWLAQPLVLMAWPIGLWLWCRNKRNNGGGKRSDD